MLDRGLCDIRSFSGYLELGDFSIPINFAAHIDNRGEVEFDFGSIALTQETMFIRINWDKDHNYFSLTGKSTDGIEFKTEDFQFNSVGHETSREHGSRMTLAGRCSRAYFRRILTELSPNPIICMWLKGFRSFRQMEQNCRLGKVSIGGKSSIEDPDTITGYISVIYDGDTSDQLGWRKEAEELLEHLRRVMSFGSATVLQAPITEYFAGSELEVVALSQTRQAPAFLQTFHYLDQQPIFDAAVKSFFDPPFIVKNLFFAIEWFAMDATFNEVRLVNAMTVIENLVASNLENCDSLIRPPKEFDKTRTKLRQVIKKCVDKWSVEDAEKVKDVVAELNEKLADLNRRSIFQKLKILAERWSVPLEGISDDKIKAAKRARDLIVHRGHYYEEENDKTDDLWEHVTIIREIVVRFLLTAIGYKGRYLSYLGGYHDANFPPREVNEEATEAT